jgi:hypothetical protein
MQSLRITVKITDFRILRVYSLAHQPHLISHGPQCLRYVRNLLVHRYKGTKNI